jgi:hypothetical protein
MADLTLQYPTQRGISIPTTPVSLYSFNDAGVKTIRVNNLSGSTIRVLAFPTATITDPTTYAEMGAGGDSAIRYTAVVGDSASFTVEGKWEIWVCAATAAATINAEATAPTVTPKAPGPATFAGRRAFDLYPDRSIFIVNPALACVTFDPSINPVTDAAYVLAVDGEAVAGVIDSGARGTSMAQATAGNKPALNSDAVVIRGPLADQNVPGLTGQAASARVLATGTGNVAGIAAQGGLTVFAVTNQAANGSTRVFLGNGNGANQFYYTKQNETVIAFMNSLSVPYTASYANAGTLPDLYVMGFVYDRTAGTLHIFHNAGKTLVATGIASFTPQDLAWQIGGLASLASNSLSGDLLWAAMYEGALDDATVRAELNALCYEFGVRDDLIVVHGNSFGLICYNTSNNTPEHCFPQKLASYIQEPFTLKSFCTSGVSIQTLTGAAEFRLKVNPWNACEARTNQFLVLHEATNALQTAIGVDPGSAVASVIADLTAYGAQAQTEGWQTILCGVTSRSNAGVATGFNTYAKRLNDYLRANYASMGFAGFADVWADSILGGDSASADTSLFFDGLHLTPAGQSRLSQIIANVIRPLWKVAA